MPFLNFLSKDRFAVLSAAIDKTLQLGLVTVIYLLLIGCAPRNAAVAVASSPAEPVTVTAARMKPASLALYYSLKMTDSLLAGDHDAAYIFGMELLKVDKSVEAATRVVSIAMESNGYEKALKAIELVLPEHPYDNVLSMMYVDLLVRMNKVEQATGAMEKYYRHRLAESGGKKTPPKTGNAENSDASDDFEPELAEVQIWLTRLYQNSPGGAPEIPPTQAQKEALKFIQGIPNKNMALSLEEINLLRNMGQKREAGAKLSRLLKKYGGSAEIWLVAAGFAEQDKDYVLAANRYFTASKLGAGQEIWLRGVSMLIAAPKPLEALKVVMAQKSDPDLQMRAATIFMDAKDWEKARQILDSVAKHPDAPDEVNFFRAILVYEEKNNIQEGLNYLEKIPPGNPYYDRRLRMEILMQAESGNIEQAIAAARRFRDAYPEEKEAWLMLAGMLSQTGKFQEETVLLEQALKTWPDDTAILYSLGISYDLAGEKKKAMEIMYKIISMEPDNPLALNHIGYTLADENRELQKALGMITRALEQEPDSAAIIDSLAWVNFRLGNLEKAWEIINMCVQLESREAEIWQHYAEIALALGKKLEAAEGYRKAIELSPGNKSQLEKKLQEIK